jgi:hypothetical protein
MSRRGQIESLNAAQELRQTRTPLAWQASARSGPGFFPKARWSKAEHPGAIRRLYPQRAVAEHGV